MPLVTRDDDGYSAEANQDYEVGYRRPPVQHRFQKGKSGNPGGRKRRTRATDRIEPPGIIGRLITLLEERVSSRINGRVVKVLMRDLVARKLMADLLGSPAERMRVVKLLASSGHLDILERLDDLQAEMRAQFDISPEVEAQIIALAEKYVDIPPDE